MSSGFTQEEMEEKARIADELKRKYLERKKEKSSNKLIYEVPGVKGVVPDMNKDGVVNVVDMILYANTKEGAEALKEDQRKREELAKKVREANRRKQKYQESKQGRELTEPSTEAEKQVEKANLQYRPIVTQTFDINKEMENVKSSSDEYYNISGVGYVEKDAFYSMLENWKNAGYSQIGVTQTGVQPISPSSAFVRPEAEDTYTMGTTEAFKFITSQRGSEGRDLFRSNVVLNNLQLEISKAYKEGYKYVTINPITGHVIGKYKEQPTLEDIESAVHAAGGDILDITRAENLAQKGGFLSKEQSKIFQKAIKYTPEEPSEGIYNIENMMGDQSKVSQDIAQMVQGVQNLPSAIRQDTNYEVDVMSGGYKGTKFYSREGLSNYLSQLSNVEGNLLNTLNQWKGEKYGQVEVTEEGIKPHIPTVETSISFEEFRQKYLTPEQRNNLTIEQQRKAYERTFPSGVVPISKLTSEIENISGGYVNIQGLGTYGSEDILSTLQEWKNKGFQNVTIKNNTMLPYVPSVSSLNPADIFNAMRTSPEPVINIRGFGEIPDTGVAYTDEEGNEVTWSEYFSNLANQGIQSMRITGEGEQKSIVPNIPTIPFTSSIADIVSELNKRPEKIVNIQGIGEFAKEGLLQTLRNWEQAGITTIKPSGTEGQFEPLIPSAPSNSVSEIIKKINETPEKIINIGGAEFNESEILPTLQKWQSEGITKITTERDEKGNISLKPFIPYTRTTSISGLLKTMEETPEGVINIGGFTYEEGSDKEGLKHTLEEWKSEGITEISIADSGISPVIRATTISSLPSEPKLTDTEKLSTFISEWESYRSNLENLKNTISDKPFVRIGEKLYKASDINDYIDKTLRNADNFISNISSQQDKYYFVKPTSEGKIQFEAPALPTMTTSKGTKVLTAFAGGSLPPPITLTHSVVRSAEGDRLLMPNEFVGSREQAVFKAYDIFRPIESAFKGGLERSNIIGGIQQALKVMNIPTEEYYPSEYANGFLTSKIKNIKPSIVQLEKAGLKAVIVPIVTATNPITSALFKKFGWKPEEVYKETFETKPEVVEQGGVPYSFFLKTSKELGYDTSDIEAMHQNLQYEFANALSEEKLSPFVAQQFRTENPPFEEGSTEKVYFNPETGSVEFKPKIDWESIYQRRGEALWETYKEHPIQGFVHYVGLGLVNPSDAFHFKTIFHETNLLPIAGTFLGGAVIGSYEIFKNKGIPKLTASPEGIKYRAGKTQLEEETIRQQPFVTQAVHVLSTPLAIAGYSAAITIGAPAIAGVGATAGSEGAGSIAAFGYAHPLISTGIKAGIYTAGGLMMGNYIAQPIADRDVAELGARMSEMGIYTLAGIGAYDLYYGKPYFTPKIKSIGTKIKSSIKSKIKPISQAPFKYPITYEESVIGYYNLPSGRYVKPGTKIKAPLDFETNLNNIRVNISKKVDALRRLLGGKSSPYNYAPSANASPEELLWYRFGIWEKEALEKAGSVPVKATLTYRTTKGVSKAVSKPSKTYQTTELTAVGGERTQIFENRITLGKGSEYYTVDKFLDTFKIKGKAPSFKVDKAGRLIWQPGETPYDFLGYLDRIAIQKGKIPTFEEFSTSRLPLLGEYPSKVPIRLSESPIEIRTVHTWSGRKFPDIDYFGSYTIEDLRKIPLDVLYRMNIENTIDDTVRPLIYTDWTTTEKFVPRCVTDIPGERFSTITPRYTTNIPEENFLYRINTGLADIGEIPLRNFNPRKMPTSFARRLSELGIDMSDVEFMVHTPYSEPVVENYISPIFRRSKPWDLRPESLEAWRAEPLRVETNKFIGQLSVPSPDDFIDDLTKYYLARVPESKIISPPVSNLEGSQLGAGMEKSVFYRGGYSQYNRYLDETIINLKKLPTSPPSGQKTLSEILSSWKTRDIANRVFVDVYNKPSGVEAVLRIEKFQQIPKVDQKFLEKLLRVSETSDKLSLWNRFMVQLKQPSKGEIYKLSEMQKLTYGFGDIFIKGKPVEGGGVSLKFKPTGGKIIDYNTLKKIRLNKEELPSIIGEIVQEKGVPQGGAVSVELTPKQVQRLIPKSEYLHIDFKLLSQLEELEPIYTFAFPTSVYSVGMSMMLTPTIKGVTSSLTLHPSVKEINVKPMIAEVYSARSVYPETILPMETGVASMMNELKSISPMSSHLASYTTSIEREITGEYNLQKISPTTIQSHIQTYSQYQLPSSILQPLEINLPYQVEIPTLENIPITIQTPNMIQLPFQTNIPLQTEIPDITPVQIQHPVQIQTPVEIKVPDLITVLEPLVPKSPPPGISTIVYPFPKEKKKKQKPKKRPVYRYIPARQRHFEIGEIMDLNQLATNFNKVFNFSFKWTNPFQPPKKPKKKRKKRSKK